MYESYSGNLEGTMNIPGGVTTKIGEPDFNTLDEPIKVTIVSISVYSVSNFTTWVHFEFSQFLDAWSSSGWDEISTCTAT